MKVTVIHARRLTPELQEMWSDIQQSDASLASPYFRPEFTAAVSAVRDDVYVAVLQDAGEVVGFFPFQRNHAGDGLAHFVKNVDRLRAVPGVRFVTASMLTSMTVQSPSLVN